ncbi:hypothetical protein FRC10_009275 [Ceratobasidium sp. 414]|nr:hypothetical protein FRC10_009275 [Ceratobasidium sp. 414]
MVFEAGSPESRRATLSIPNITTPTAWIDTYYPWLDTPGERKLEILDDDGSVLWSADLEEKFEEGDPAGKWHDNLGAWHALSKGGEARGKLVYAGYGRKWEFDELVAAGDPTTPGTPSYRNANRTEPLSVPAIPSLPISYNNGKVLLDLFEGDPAVFSKREVRLVNTVHNKIAPVWNTMAVIPGYMQDEIVIIGNHRDGLGVLLKKGWRPLRTIVVASWDAEEIRLPLGKCTGPGVPLLLQAFSDKPLRSYHTQPTKIAPCGMLDWTGDIFSRTGVIPTSKCRLERLYRAPAAE